MAFETACYMIIKAADLKNLDYKQLSDTSKESSRKSVDGLKAVVEWEGETIPDTIKGLSSTLGPYTHEKIIPIMDTPEWTDQNPLI